MKFKIVRETTWALALTMAFGCGNFQEYTIPDVPGELRIPPADENYAALVAVLEGLRKMQANLLADNASEEIIFGDARFDYENLTGNYLDSPNTSVVNESLERIEQGFGGELIFYETDGLNPDGEGLYTSGASFVKQVIGQSNTSLTQEGTLNFIIEDWEAPGVARFSSDEEEGVDASIDCTHSAQLAEERFCSIQFTRQYKPFGACWVDNLSSKQACEEFAQARGEEDKWEWLALDLAGETSGGECSDTSIDNYEECVSAKSCYEFDTGGGALTSGTCSGTWSEKNQTCWLNKDESACTGSEEIYTYNLWNRNEAGGDIFDRRQTYGYCVSREAIKVDDPGMYDAPKPIDTIKNPAALEESTCSPAFSPSLTPGSHDPVKNIWGYETVYNWVSGFGSQAEPMTWSAIYSGTYKVRFTKDGKSYSKTIGFEGPFVYSESFFNNETTRDKMLSVSMAGSVRIDGQLYTFQNTFQEPDTFEQSGRCYVYEEQGSDYVINKDDLKLAKDGDGNEYKTEEECDALGSQFNDAGEIVENPLVSGSQETLTVWLEDGEDFTPIELEIDWSSECTSLNSEPECNENSEHCSWNAGAFVCEAK